MFLEPLAKSFVTGSRIGAGGRLHNGSGHATITFFVFLSTRKWMPPAIYFACLGAKNCSKSGRGASATKQQWRRLTSPLQMRQEMEHVDLEAVRHLFMTADASARAVLLGSVVSPAWLGRMIEDEDPRCPWCNKTGSYLHISWECRRFPLSANRPIKPSSWLWSRFGWPPNGTTSHHHHLILRWLAAVQEEIWLVRHGSTRTSIDPADQ